jgi:hypothetical protein
VALLDGEYHNEAQNYFGYETNNRLKKQKQSLTMSHFSTLLAPNNTFLLPRSALTSSTIPGAFSNKVAAKTQARKRAKFVLFIDTLLRCLEVHASPELKLQAKRVISECTRLNRLGNPYFSPLMRSITLHLRGLVGEVLWAQVHKDFQEISKVRQQRLPVSSVRTTMNSLGSGAASVGSMTPPFKPRDSWQQMLAMEGANATMLAGDSFELLTAVLHAGETSSMSPKIPLPRRDSLQQYLDAFCEANTRRRNSFQLAQDSIQQLLAMNSGFQAGSSGFADSLQLVEPHSLLDSFPVSPQTQHYFSSLYRM